MQSFRPRRRRVHSSSVSSTSPAGTPSPSATSAAPAAAAPRPVVAAPSRPVVPATPRPVVAPQPGAPRVEDLGLSAPLLRAIAEEGYTTPTPIQAAVVAPALQGRDVVGCAQTGTGKTAAFVLPILQRLAAEPATRKIRALILTPTRELAAQIAERISVYGKHLSLRHIVIFGGVGQRPQEQALRASPDILVATPGRLLDLIEQGHVRLDGITHFVLDEADRMLDMGFIHDVRRVVARLPQRRQTLFFSATMPDAITGLANSLLVDPVRVEVERQGTAAETVAQSVVFAEKAEKRAILERILREQAIDRAIVFTRTKHGANRLREQLEKSGLDAAVIHGNKSQGARERALDAFRTGATRVLVATDIAARGIDVEGISHVINFELPDVAESYVHRIGRTGRAGATGRAITLCDLEERDMLLEIEKLIRQRLPLEGGGERPADTLSRGASPRGPSSHRFHGGRMGGGGNRGPRDRGGRHH